MTYSPLDIQAFVAEDWLELWRILEPVFRAGETYAYPRDINEQDAFKAWVAQAQQCFIARDNDGELLGSYFIKPNQSGPGDHVCNCGYVVSVRAAGKGVATAMCLHSQKQALEANFEAMQFNLVVSTNSAAIYLWEKLGFSTVGVLPGAYRHASLGRVDALVMYKLLGDHQA